MKFTPRTEEDIKAEAEKRGPWPAGIYDAEIFTAEDGISKAGNDMITICLNVYHPDGERRQVFDWLVEAMAYKLRNCAAACNLMAKYEVGELQAWEMEGRSVKVKIGIDAKGEIKRNKVMDYVVLEGASATSAPSAPRKAVTETESKKADLDDDVPF